MGIKRAIKKILGRDTGAGQPPMWHPDRGEDYKSFWTSMSNREDEAILATYGKLVPEAERLACCRYIADYIADALELNDEKEILEVGCGLGLYAYTLGPRCKRYVGTDISPNMIDHSRRFTQGIGGNLDFAVLTHSDLRAFPDESFDAVFFEAVLMHIAREDAFHYLCEAHRVLRTGGRLYASFQNLLQTEGFQHFLRMTTEIDHTGTHAVGRVRFHTAPELRKLAWGAGFQIDERHARLELEENDSKRHEARTLTVVAEKSERPEWKPESGWAF